MIGPARLIRFCRHKSVDIPIPTHINRRLKARYGPIDQADLPKCPGIPAAVKWDALARSRPHIDKSDLDFRVD